MRYKTAFRLGLKVIGVWIVASSLPGLVVWGLRVGWLYAQGAGGLATPLTRLSFEALNALHNGLELLLGLYLFFGAEWVVRLAIPSNRPYCPECGYDLSGLSRGQRCPECGTILPVALRDAARQAPIEGELESHEGERR